MNGGSGTVKTPMRALMIASLAVLTLGWPAHGIGADQSYTVVDTGQTKCYDNYREIAPPGPGQPFYGQDAQHQGNPPAYRDNGDGTVTDLNTGLMWVQARGAPSKST
jgi:hypothetical protein